MTDSIRCPDCGEINPPDATACRRCNYPLVEGVPPAPSAPAAIPVEAITEASPVIERPLPRRPLRRPPRAPQQANLALSIWLFVGGFAAILLVFMGIKANVDRANQPVEGSTREQQQRADELQQALVKDSTNVDARQQLADLFYDTKNWPEAASHYRRVVAADSTRVTALVDLGVALYNMGDANEAERHFMLALRRDPHQPIALFNLGIVHERREELEDALRYYHAAMQSDPPENMNEALMQAMQRIQEKTGKTPGPLR